MANIKYIKVGNQTHTIRDPDASKIYVSSESPQEGSAGDLWLKVYRDEAYAVFDSNDGSLTIFRDEAGKYTDGQIVDTKTYYTGIEDITGETNPKWYNNKSSVTKIAIEDTFKPKTAYKLFHDMNGLVKIEGMENFDTSECTNMMSMFGNCGNLTELDLSHFDTSKVTNMIYMFWLCNNLTATLNIMKMPSEYGGMCLNTSQNSGQLTLKYTSPVTSADIDLLVATENYGNVVNGGPA